MNHQNEIKQCPLCYSSQIKTKEEISFEDLKEIWSFSKNVFCLEKYLPKQAFLLKECLNCGLEFFEPFISPNPEFYDIVASDGYYGLRWDAKMISDYILNLKINSVLDYGCGSGEFLKTLPQGIKKLGIDFNVKNFSDKNLNLEFKAGDLLSFQTQEKFESVVCLQVLEHLTKVKEHLLKMLSLLKQGGYLFVSVPNQNGILRQIKNQGKSLDFPPHHLTRWSGKPLRKIAELFSLKLIKIDIEPLSYIHFRWAINMRLAIRFKGKGFLRKAFRKFLFLSQEAILPFFYNKYKRRIAGHTILAVFQKSNEN